MLIVFMLRVIMLRVVMLKVVMLSVNVLNAAILNVVTSYLLMGHHTSLLRHLKFQPSHKILA
jgi:hypothetical protein